MTEAECVLAGEIRPVGLDQALADERGEMRHHLYVLGYKRLHGAEVEDLAVDRGPLEHDPLADRELIEARCEQRLQRRRDDDLAVGVAGDRQHLPDEERVAARCPHDLLP